MATKRFIFGLVAAPIAAPLLLVAYFTPVYVPSAALAETAAAASASPEQDLAGTLAAYCPTEWNVEARDFDRPVRLYSWENDVGLFGVTEIACVPGEGCRVEARALVASPGMGIWGRCGETGVGLYW